MDSDQEMIWCDGEFHLVLLFAGSWPLAAGWPVGWQVDPLHVADHLCGDREKVMLDQIINRNLTTLTSHETYLLHLPHLHWQQVDLSLGVDGEEVALLQVPCHLHYHHHENLQLVESG